METMEPQVKNSKSLVRHETGKLQSPLNEFLNFLIKCNQPIEPDKLSDLLREYAIDIEHVRELVRYDDNIYARHSILKLPHIEVLVMGWKSGQLTPIHDHAGSACAVKVLQGVATEITYTRTGSGMILPSKSESFPAPGITSSFDEDIHQLGNVESDGPELVTLHCYSPPLSNMQMFSVEKTIFSDYSKTFNLVNERIDEARKKNVAQ